MTQDEKRIKLAEAAGFTQEEPWLNGSKCWGHKNHPKHIGFEEIPDYFNDLNAVHELEETLTDKQWPEYREELRTVVLGGIRLISQWCKADIHATAAERCEALGLTLGLWEAAK
jgi:hypothetical protein